MSFLSSIKNFATGGQQQQSNGSQQQQQQQQQPQGGQNGNNLPTGQGQQFDPNASPANPNQQVNGSNTPVDPSDLWNKMWDTTNDGEKAQTPPQLNIDPSILNEVSGKLDFMQGVDPALMQKATSGDAQALIDIMQHVARGAYRNSLSHSGKLTNEFIGQREAFSGQKLPSLIKSQLTDSLLQGEGGKAPPFVQKQMQDLAKRMQQANPDATPAQVKQSVQEYIQQLYQFAGGGQGSNGGQSDQNQNVQQGTDWDKWFGGSGN